MPDAPVVHIGENSPEQVALQLFRDILHVEGKKLMAGQAGTVNREWILRTYRQCILTVKGGSHMDEILKVGPQTGR